jgi:hypothetical protein
MSHKSFQGINFSVAGPLWLVGQHELESAEQVLRCRFPSDYRDFVLRFGSGEFQIMPFRVLRPADILRTTVSDQARLADYWFWNDSPKIWNKTQALESIACFGGTSGDDMRFHPKDPRFIYLLPHEENFILKLTGFADIVAYYCRLAPRKTENIIFHPDKLAN